MRQSTHHFFGRNISDEIVLREGTATQSAHRRVETSAPGIVRGQNFRDRSRARAVQMNAHFAANRIGQHCGDDTLHEFRLRGADRVSKRDGCDPKPADELRRFRNFALRSKDPRKDSRTPSKCKQPFAGRLLLRAR